VATLDLHFNYEKDLNWEHWIFSFSFADKKWKAQSWSSQLQKRVGTWHL